MIACHLGGPSSVVFPKRKTINYCHVTYFIRFYWSYSIKVIGIGYAANYVQIILNRRRVITVFSDFMQIRLEPCLHILEQKHESQGRPNLFDLD